MSLRTKERVALFNGEFMPEREVRVPFRDLSWVYGDGCFDMTRSFGHRLFKVKEHVDRLYRSLKYLRIDPGFGPARPSWTARGKLGRRIIPPQAHRRRLGANPHARCTARP